MDVSDLRSQIRPGMFKSLIEFGLSGFTSKVIGDSKLARIINQYDLCVIGGGGLYNWWFFPMNHKLLNSIDTPIILYGLGHVGNFGLKMLPRAHLKSIIALNKRAKLSSVRDLETYEFLRRLNITNVQVIGDPAMFLEKKKPSGVCFEKGKVKIGLNIACHDWELQAEYLDRVINECQKTCKFLIDNLDAQIVYLQHTPNETIVINELSKKLPIQVANYSAHELNWIYSNLDLVIGMQLHSAIFAFGNCIPVINIAYDLKNSSFMKLIGQSDKLINVRNVDSERLTETVYRTLNNSKEIKLDFRKLKNNFWQKQVSFINDIQSLIC